jgi:hypothetical protein
MEIWAKRGRAAAYSVAFFSALLLGLVASFLYERSAQTGRVGRGIEWGGETISGYGKAGFKTLLLSRDKQARSVPIELSLGEARKQFLAGDLGVALQMVGTQDRALSVGRRGSFFRQFGFFCARLFSTHEIPLVLAVDEDMLKRAVAPWLALLWSTCP